MLLWRTVHPASQNLMLLIIFTSYGKNKKVSSDYQNTKANKHHFPSHTYFIVYSESCTPGNLQMRCSANHTDTEEFLVPLSWYKQQNCTSTVTELYSFVFTEILTYYTTKQARKERELIRITCQIISRGYNCSSWVWSAVQILAKKRWLPVSINS